MNTEQIKQKLYDLVDNLNFNKASTDISMISSDGETCSANGRVPKKVTYHIEMIERILKQREEEKTLEQKLIDYGFVKLSDAITNCFKKNNITVQVFPPTNLCAIIQTDNLISCDYNNHNQILADIEYLENRNSKLFVD